jgi:hypothetical protein
MLCNEDNETLCVIRCNEDGIIVLFIYELAFSKINLWK